MAESVFEIRRLKKEDLAKYHAFSDAEVWNVGIDVYEKMFEISPNGFFCAENSETHEIVRFCGAVDIGDNRAIVVSFITKPLLRGRGIGTRVIKKVLEQFQNYEIIVNSAVGREKMYERLGMKKFLYQTNQLICRPKMSKNNEKRKFSRTDLLLEIDDVFEFDQKICKSERKNILKWFFKTSEKGYVAKNEKGEINGYALVRKTPLGISLSPFYAQTETSLRVILENVLFDFPTCDVQICLPIENKFTLKILEEYFHIKISSCCVSKDAPENLALSLTNTWLGSKEDFEFEKSSVVSILDFHFAVC
ncbi:unnamed protein product [Oikopleura dioica]|uniref:N-acetyltransferase domain-containing protein n=1 Tax=Oikopleura dioica TaxID=34765 RepID=E4X1V6_OIKDI|nr:unnamed protein product [Oikopleura dioica]